MITRNFHTQKEPTFLQLLNGIQTRLAQLHDGSDEEYKAKVAILEDIRDRELLEVEAARGFALERAEREYQQEKQQAEREYQVPPLHLPFLNVLLIFVTDVTARQKERQRGTPKQPLI